MSTPEILRNPNAEPSLLDFPIMELVVIKEVRDRLYDCVIPPYLLDVENVPLDQKKFESIRDDMRRLRVEGGSENVNGQKVPVTAGYVIGDDQFIPTDGYHRGTALVEDGQPINTIIELMSRERLIDERIKNANMHDNIKHARLAIWMDEAWSYFPLSATINLEQALSLAVNRNVSGKIMGVNAEAKNDITAWINAKAEAWKMSARTMKVFMKTSRDLAPDLMADVRSDPESARPGSRSVTPTTAKRITKELPGEQHYDHQRIVAEAVSSGGLNATKADKLAAEIKNMSPEEARKYVANLSHNSVSIGPSAEPQSFNFNLGQIVTLGAKRETIGPLRQVSDLTYSAILDLNAGHYNPEKLDQLLNDLRAVHRQVVEMVTIVEASTEGDESTSIIQTSSLAPGEFDNEFMSKLGSGLDDGLFPDITNDEQLEIAEDALADKDVMSDVSSEVRKKLKELIAAYKSTQERS